jgi:AraC family transcriptional regulator of adaptative response / methylphosphotriester-DNA alkyltransferase methyltransferase
MARIDLYDVRQWLEMARQSAYQADVLSEELGVSQRQLQRYTKKLFESSPQNWLNTQRLILAGNMLKECRSVKTVSSHLGFKQTSHFSREFKLYYGLSPTGFLTWNDRHVRDNGMPRQKETPY